MMNIRALYYAFLLITSFIPTYSQDLQKLETGNVSNDMLLSFENKQVLNQNTGLNELAKRYNLDGNTLSNIDEKYGLKEGTTLCIAIAETGGGKKGRGRPGCRNYGNVGRKCFKSSQEGLEAIGKTLNNKYLRNNETIGCLSAAGVCTLPKASKSRYAMDKSGNWQKNIVGCFYKIYKTKINPKTFNLHKR